MTVFTERHNTMIAARFQYAKENRQLSYIIIF